MAGGSTMDDPQGWRRPKLGNEEGKQKTKERNMEEQKKNTEMQKVAALFLSFFLSFFQCETRRTFEVGKVLASRRLKGWWWGGGVVAVLVVVVGFRRNARKTKDERPTGPV